VPVGVWLSNIFLDQGGHQTASLAGLESHIPSFIHITDSKMHMVNVLGSLMLKPEAFYLMVRGYLDFARLLVIYVAQA